MEVEIKTSQTVSQEEDQVEGQGPVRTLTKKAKDIKVRDILDRWGK